jgi:hypothetical protein
MRNGLIILCLIILAVAVGVPLLHELIGVVGGLVIAPLAVAGSLLLAGFIILLVFTGVGIIGLGVLGLMGVILLAPVIPLLFPLLIVIIPVALLLKLLTRI